MTAKKKNLARHTVKADPEGAGTRSEKVVPNWKLKKMFGVERNNYLYWGLPMFPDQRKQNRTSKTSVRGDVASALTGRGHKVEGWRVVF